MDEQNQPDQERSVTEAPVLQGDSFFAAIGAPREIDVDTSETSSYASSGQENNGDERPTYQEKDVEVDMHEEGLDGDKSTYSKFKTANEMEIEAAFKSGPPFITLDELDQIEKVGPIVQFIQQGIGMALIQPEDPLRLLDIENYVCLGNKEIIGFIYELVGPVTFPLYSVQLYAEFVDKVNTSSSDSAQKLREALHGKDCYVVKRTLKLINNRLDDLMQQKGCDASNQFDEECPENEREFSDDEAEKEFRRKKKQSKKRRTDLEEGEIEEEHKFTGKKRANQDRDKKWERRQYRQSQYRDSAQIPQYSTSHSVVQQQNLMMNPTMPPQQSQMSWPHQAQMQFQMPYNSPQFLQQQMMFNQQLQQQQQFMYQMASAQWAQQQQMNQGGFQQDRGHQ